MRLLLGVLTAAMFAGGALAQNANDFAFANEAAQVVGGADACGYKLDDAKLEEFMSKVADLDQMSRLHFTNARGVQTSNLDRMGTTERKAQCALQAKLAQKYGLTP